MAIKWSTSKEEEELIGKIVKRAKSLGIKRDTFALHMDISATHGGCPLLLEELLNAEEPDFMHDIHGIIRHLNRETGELCNFFLPRYARLERHEYLDTEEGFASAMYDNGTGEYVGTANSTGGV